MSIIGVEWNQGTDTWSRIDVNGDALSPPTFNSEAPWGNIVRCTLNADGSENEVSANGKGNDISLDGSTGRVMVRIPKFWIKSDSPGANRYRWWISDAAYSGFVVHPAFYQRGNTDAPADYIYVGAYEAGSNNTVLRSQTGDTVKVSQTIGAFRTQAEAIDSAQWGITSMWALSAIKLLYYIEYADADSQTTIGQGIVTDGAKSATGADGIDANLATNGTGSGTSTDGSTPIAYRGIENPWGNVYLFIDGYEAVDAEYRIIKRDGSGTFRNPLQAGDYEASTAAPITVDGYVKNIEYETLLAYLFIASNITGSSGTYLHDTFKAHDTGETNILRMGGAWAEGYEGGIAFLRSAIEAAFLTTFCGARLEFIPGVLPVTHYGAATLSGVGTLAGIGRGIFIGQATLSGTGTLSSIGRLIAIGKATLSGAGTLSAIGSFWRYGVATLSGTGTLVANSVITAIGKATLSGTGSLSAIGRRIFTGVVTLSGVGTLTGIAHITAIGKATLSGIGTLAAIGIVRGIQLGVVALSGVGTLAVSGVTTLIGKVTLSGQGSLSAIGQIGKILYGKATLSGVGTLTAYGFIVRVIKVTLALYSRAITATLYSRSLTSKLYARAITLLTRTR